MTTLTRYAVLAASQTAQDATSGILHADAAEARRTARELTKRAAEPFYDTDRLLDGPYRCVAVTVQVHDDAGADQPHEG